MGFFYDEKTGEYNGKRIAKVVTAGLLALIFGLRSLTIVPAGHVKVTHLFGKVAAQELQPGLQVINPLRGRITFDVRTKEIKEVMEVPTKEGLLAGLDVSVLYHVNPAKADEVFKKVGMEYQGTIVEPIIRNAIRDTVATYTSEDLYGPKRQMIANDSIKTIADSYKERGLVLEKVLLREVRLPGQVKDAIEAKIRAKQQSEQMEWVIEKQKKESDRMRIEATGIADAQRTIAGSLTPSYLQWKYIDTLEKLVGSQNTTYVITPFDQKLVPMLPMQK